MAISLYRARRAKAPDHVIRYQEIEDGSWTAEVLGLTGVGCAGATLDEVWRRARMAVGTALGLDERDSYRLRLGWDLRPRSRRVEVLYERGRTGLWWAWVPAFSADRSSGRTRSGARANALWHLPFGTNPAVLATIDFRDGRVVRRRGTHTILSDRGRVGMTFSEWVRKWLIGQGMNDGNPAIGDRLAGHRAIGQLRGHRPEVAARPDRTDLLRRLQPGEAATAMIKRVDEQLYSGFDGTVGPGWIPLLDRLAADLVALSWDRDLHQVKEKFGTLHFYIGRGTEEMANRIVEAEEESSRICEECGRPAVTSPRDSEWYRTLWKRCHVERARPRRAEQSATGRSSDG